MTEINWDPFDDKATVLFECDHRKKEKQLNWMKSIQLRTMTTVLEVSSIVWFDGKFKDKREEYEFQAGDPKKWNFTTFEVRYTAFQ